jgi:tRNA-dihydrouridine synthase B
MAPAAGRGSSPAQLTDAWMLGCLRVPNRVLLAPLAGIGNWFVRLQARRYGAGMTFSEMVSSHAIYHGNEKTCVEMLRIHPQERTAGPGAYAGGPVAIQLFGEDPQVMRQAAARVALTGADAIDINMGCPVRKVCKTGAGAGLLANPDLAVRLARAAREGAADGGRELPVTVKLRSGLRPGEESGFGLAHRLVEEAGVAAIAFHPRSAAVRHKGVPDYALAERLVRSLPAPVILTGGLHDAARVQSAYRASGAAAVMLARGSLGNPWLFSRLLALDDREPPPQEVLRELRWTMDRAVEHLGERRATRYLRKFYPWYVARLGLDPAAAKRLGEALQSVETLALAQELLGAALAQAPPALAAA